MLVGKSRSGEGSPSTLQGGGVGETKTASRYGKLADLRVKGDQPDLSSRPPGGAARPMQLADSLSRHASFLPSDLKSLPAQEESIPSLREMSILLAVLRVVAPSLVGLPRPPEEKLSPTGDL
ncbi:MAG: hypothetical protein KJ970_13350 [Candidatus Eisenbacteria bacterium]|uniref:Uncharacterized protein n=1 Tax=Eiseniibacteriota bacterium TaxID=2212470 RepID=A0A948W766_UNCEI|nr:hypothetical protein [Candidatus Eisenbacteria bacterium]